MLASLLYVALAGKATAQVLTTYFPVNDSSVTFLRNGLAAPYVPCTFAGNNDSLSPNRFTAGFYETYDPNKCNGTAVLTNSNDALSFTFTGERNSGRTVRTTA